MVAVAIIEVLLRSHPDEFGGHGRQRFSDQHEAFGITVGQRMQKYGVHHAENCRARTDPEGQSEDCNRSKSRILAQLPQGITNVLCQSTHLGSSSESV